MSQPNFAWQSFYEPAASTKNSAIARDYISELGNQATEIGIDLGLDPSGIHNGAMDALRHAYGASKLSEVFGRAPTEFAGLVREIFEYIVNARNGMQSAGNEFVMDVLNNKVGVGMGSSAVQDLYFAIASGKLTVIDHDGSLRSTDFRDVGGHEWDGIDVDHEMESPAERLNHDLGGDDGDTYEA